MRLEHFDPTSHGDTLAAVIVGALLATLSGIFATLLEAHFKRRERERDAALLFGELFSTLRILVANAVRSREFGDPDGPITRRMLHVCRRELDIYDRNRERLYDLRDADLRVRIHALMIRIAMSIDGIRDAWQADGDRAEDALTGTRAQGFDFLKTAANDIPAAVTDLARIGKHSFSAYSRVSPGGRTDQGA